MNSRPLVRAGAASGLLLPGLPVHGEGETLDDAVDDLIDALRDYAEDWNDHLLAASNHVDNWPLVQLVELSSDQQLRGWILGAEATPRTPVPPVPEPR